MRHFFDWFTKMAESPDLLHLGNIHADIIRKIIRKERPSSITTLFLVWFFTIWVYIFRNNAIHLLSMKIFFSCFRYLCNGTHCFRIFSLNAGSNQLSRAWNFQSNLTMCVAPKFEWRSVVSTASISAVLRCQQLVNKSLHKNNYCRKTNRARSRTPIIHSWRKLIREKRWIREFRMWFGGPRESIALN